MTPTPRTKAKTDARGYGYAHRKERAKWKPLVDAGQADCWRCGEHIEAGTPWDLGHDDNDRNEYRGPEHPGCNRGAPHRATTPTPRSRVW